MNLNIDTFSHTYSPHPLTKSRLLSTSLSLGISHSPAPPSVCETSTSNFSLVPHFNVTPIHVFPFTLALSAITKSIDPCVTSYCWGPIHTHDRERERFWVTSHTNCWLVPLERMEVLDRLRSITKRGGLNNVLVFEPTSIVTGNIPTEYIKCESTAFSIKDIRYDNLDHDFRVRNIGGFKSIIKMRERSLA